MISRLLEWLDTSLLRYEVCAWTCFAAFLIVSVVPTAVRRRPLKSWWLHSWIYCAAVLLCLAAFHWPFLLDNQELQDPDESQLIAAAITLNHDPLFFRSVDGATCGPIDEIPLTALAMMGMRID